MFNFYLKRARHTVRTKGVISLLKHAVRFIARICKRFYYSIIFSLLNPKRFLLLSDSEIVPAERVASGDEQLVTIIIPFRDEVALLKACIESILSKTAYQNYRILLVDNESTQPGTAEYLQSLTQNQRISIVRYTKPFNYAALHNWAMQEVKSDYVLFLNSDTEITEPGWLGALVAHIGNQSIGAAGALLLYPDGSVQHAGVTVGLYHEPAKHLYVGRNPSGGSHDLIYCARELLAVTGACLMTKKSLYTKVGGFDETNLPITLNDIDYCLKLREAGYRTVYEPLARLVHHESYSRGFDYEDDAKRMRADTEKRFFMRKWRKYADKDPFYSIVDEIRSYLFF